MIRKTSSAPVSGRRSISAGTSITANAKTREARSVMAGMDKLTPEQRNFARQLRSNIVRGTQGSVMAATNTSNIMAKPDFLELLPLFVQKLLVTDVFGSIAMRSRQQLVPFFKVVAENDKGQTKAGDILNSPFVNRQGIDPNFTGRIVKGEIIGEGEYDAMFAAYTPILPNSATVSVVEAGVATPYTDNGAGQLVDADGAEAGYIDYSTGNVVLNTAPGADAQVKMTYQYDNETVGPHTQDSLAHGQYGASMGKIQLQLDEINLIAEAHQLASYWSIYSAFAAQTEYGGNVGDIAKEAAISELTAEINTQAFDVLARAASYQPQYNWDASPVLSGSVVPSDYLNMFKLKLGQAAASIYQRTRLSRPNRLIVGTNTAEYVSMINGFRADSVEDSVGPYKLGTLDQFEVYVAPDYDPNQWVLATKSNDIRRNSALFGEYMPITATDPIGLANASVQQGYATMYAMKVVNPATVVSGKIVGLF